jgi:sugar lactone lactonase YvrE
VCQKAVAAVPLKSAKITLLSVMLVFLLAFVPHAFAFSNGQAASLVIGASSLTSFNPGATSTGLVGPYALAFDSSHNLWVADAYGNRVLEYKTPLSTHEAASVVIGQSSFTALSPATSSTGLNTPNALAFDSSGNLWVVDSSNDRVVEYKAPLSTGEAASLVIGQPSFTTNYYTVTNSTSLNSPYGLAFDSGGNLWVADLLNGRILEYTTPFSTREAASLVIGEPSFTVANDVVSKTGLNAPNSLTFDSSGNMWVVDGHRVLEYGAPFATHEAASLVIGQNTFTNSSTVTTSKGLDTPSGLAFDSSGNLWVADKLNDRVLKYATPFSTYEAAILVIGQPNFTSSATTPVTQPTSTGLNQPTGVAFDSSGNLWVADWSDGRVLQYAASSTATVSTSTTKSPSTTSSSTSSTVPEFPATALAVIMVVVLAMVAILSKSVTAKQSGLRAPRGAGSPRGS